MGNNFKIGGEPPKEEVKTDDTSKTESTPVKEETKEEMVPLSMLQGMMDEIKELKEGQKDIKKKVDDEAPDNVPENIMRLLSYEGKLVVGFNEERGTWKKYNKEKREDEIYMEVTLQDEDGKEEQKEVDYHYLMDEGRLVECPVIKKEMKEIKKEGKTIAVREVKDYRTVTTRGKVKQVVKSTKTMVTLNVPKPFNKEITLNIDYVNIK